MYDQNALNAMLCGLHDLPEDYKQALADAFSWEAACWLMNGLTFDADEFLSLYQAPAHGIG